MRSRSILVWAGGRLAGLGAALGLVRLAGATPPADPPPPAPRYQEVIDRTYDLNAFCKDPTNWSAEDKFSAWHQWQVARKLDADAVLSPHDFYGERFRFAIKQGTGHGSDTSLDVRYTVGGMYLLDPDKPYGPCRNDRWSKIYSIRKLPVDFADCNRLSAWVYVDGLQSVNMFIGMEVDYDAMTAHHERNKLPGRPRYHHVTRVAASGGQWTRVWIDYHNLDEAFVRRIRYLIIGHLWYGVQPSDNHERVHFYWDDFTLEHVANPRKFAGWDADPAVVTVNQLGYKPLAEKVAIVPASKPQSRFYVRDARTHRVVHTGGFALTRTLMGDFLEGDFTALDAPGLYYVQAGDVRSVDFPITNRPYQDAAAATLHVLAGQRSGCKTQLHEEAHMDEEWDVANHRFVDLVGGYFDAGDTRRFEHNPQMQPKFHMGVYRLLPPDDPLRPRLLDETIWCFTTLEKHYRHVGYLCFVTPNMARRCNFLTDNIVGTRDDPPFSDASRGSMAGWSGPAFADLAAAIQNTPLDRDDLSGRALALIEKIAATHGQRDLWMNVGLYRATGNPDYLDTVRRLVDRWLAGQDNRVIEGTFPPISGMIADDPHFNSFINYATERNYGSAIAGAADAMQLDEDLYYPVYFALRRYADFYLKPITRKIGPWAIPPVMVYGTDDPGDIAGGRGKMLGLVDGQPYFVTYEGQHSETGRKAAYSIVRVAGALADPQVEAIAQRTMGQIVGWNPFNFSHVHGFGEDSLTHIFTWFPLTRGMIGRYLRLNHHLRTDAHEIWTVTSCYASTSLAALDAPCQIRGTVTRSGEPFAGELTIATPGGRVAATVPTRSDGAYGPVLLPGGGHYTLIAGGRERRFPAIAGARYTVDFDAAREIALDGRRITGRVAKLVTLDKREARVLGRRPGPYVRTDVPVSMPFDGRLTSLKAGVPYTLVVAAEALGTGASTHTVAARAANATIAPAQQAVRVAPGKPTELSFTLTPGEARRTLCVLLEIDGDHLRKWEMTGVVEPNPGFVEGFATLAGKPTNIHVQVVDDRGTIVNPRMWLAKDGTFKPVALPPGTYRLRYRDRRSEPFEVRPGRPTTVELDLK